MPGQGSEGKFADKFCSRGGHHDADISTGFYAQPNEQGNFIRSDTATNTYKNPPSLQHKCIQMICVKRKNGITDFDPEVLYLLCRNNLQ